MKKKILLFIKLPPPVTGATLINQYVANSKLLNQTFDIRTIKISYNELLNQMGDVKIKKFFKILYYYIKLIRELINFRPNLVYFQISPIGMAFIRDFLYVIVLKVFNKDIVYHIHGKGIINELSNSVKRLMYKFAFNKENIITLSRLLDYDISPVYSGKIFHVPNGIPKRTEFNFKKKDNNPVQILYLSNLLLSKGLYDFLESLKFLNEQGIDYSGLIAGREADISEDDLIKKINELKIGNKTKYLGPKYEKEKDEILSSADILVFPTKYKNEAFPVVILEAMQYKIPVITTNEGAIPEIVDNGKTGFIVSKSNPKEIADKLEILIKDKDLRESMGKQGRKKFLEKYTIEQFEENLVRVFEEIINSGCAE